MFEPSDPRAIDLQADHDTKETLQKLKALASEPRLRILNLLSYRPYNVSEIAQALDLHIATATLHVNVLEQAGLLITEHRPATRGTQKVCARLYGNINVHFPREGTSTEEFTELSIPVGSYTNFDVAPTCGLVSEEAIIGLLDDPTSFYEPDRHLAGLVWFHHGFVEYRFPNRLPPGATLDSLHLSVEMCSEAPLHHNNWLSDITLWINNVEIGTWMSPADFGGQRGKLTPTWWGSLSSQYGLLKIWTVNDQESLLDGLKISGVHLQDLGVTESTSISIRLGVKPDAPHVGGVNLFGRQFGNYPQDIVLRLRHKMTSSLSERSG